jgi:hypothetical protein
MKFKVGDTIIGNVRANMRYSITCRGWRGVIIEILHRIDGNDMIKVRSIISDNTYEVASNCFDLYEMFPEDVSKTRLPKMIKR